MCSCSSITDLAGWCTSMSRQTDSGLDATTVEGGDRLGAGSSLSAPRSGPHLRETSRRIHRELRAKSSEIASAESGGECLLRTADWHDSARVLDCLIPISESHLRLLLAEWSRHYNRSRPHMSLGPGVPDPPSRSAVLQCQESRHRVRGGLVVVAKSVLDGLHHEYSVAPAAA